MSFLPDPSLQGRAQAPLAPEDQIRRLRWRARRGLLENDLILQGFFDMVGMNLSEAEHDGLAHLLDLTDTDLLPLLLSQREPEGEIDLPEVHQVLGRLRSATPQLLSKNN